MFLVWLEWLLSKKTLVCLFVAQECLYPRYSEWWLFYVIRSMYSLCRWWPSEVVHPEDIPDNILARKPGDCMFVVRFCGSRDFCWTYHGRVIPYMGGNELDGIKSKKAKASENYKRGNRVDIQWNLRLYRLYSGPYETGTSLY